MLSPTHCQAQIPFPSSVRRHRSAVERTRGARQRCAWRCWEATGHLQHARYEAELRLGSTLRAQFATAP
eukprot:6179856-Pleurochrysis_carterae.AAC.5